jgi:hypothetical protein
MKETAGFITGLFSGLDLRGRWFAGVLSVIVLLLAFWAFESYTGSFFYQTLEKRTAILERMHTLADEGIANDPLLYPIYLSTAKKLASRSDFRIPLPTISLTDPEGLGKAISGSSIWVLILIVGVSSEIRKDKRISGTTVALALTIGLVAYFFGWIGTIIPTLWHPWVNYIAFPGAQLLILWLLTRRRGT